MLIRFLYLLNGEMKKKAEYDGNSVCFGVIIGGMVVYLISTAIYVAKLKTFINNPPLTRDSCIEYITTNLK